MSVSGGDGSYHLVYYCSGHGYGHATRVSAFARHLLSLERRPAVYIVSSAPKQVFADSVATGAIYRNADIDPVIVQPLAYRVDRQKSVEILRAFLQKKDRKVTEESQWLKEIRADCVLSDAAFLGCLAAHNAGIPSVLITNFSFDSVYSFLSTPFIDAPPTPETDVFNSLPAPLTMSLPPDTPISEGTLAPLVDEILTGFRCADLLLRLPGAIPIPSFSVTPGLPSPSWVDLNRRTFTEGVVMHLKEPLSSHDLNPSLDFPGQYKPKPLPRMAVSAPLLVRSPSPSVYTAEGRRRVLNIVGIPPYLHDSDKTKILIVSFGGQVFHKPSSRIHSRSPSRVSTPGAFASAMTKSFNGIPREIPMSKPSDLSKEYFPDPDRIAAALRSAALSDTPPASLMGSPGLPPPKPVTMARTSSLKIPGAPPVMVPMSPPSKTSVTQGIPTLNTIPPSPVLTRDARAQDSFPGWSSSAELEDEMEEDFPSLLPDETWIAIVCGVSKEWGKENGEELPPGFYVAPRDIYMPDLTAVADVLLGKLGYGTVSECVDACTPFVYVPRPLFIEEHGLRLLLDSEGVGVELSRGCYERGEWADAVLEAYMRGKEAKARKRQEGETGKRREEGSEMARGLLDWLDLWKAGTRDARAPGDVGIQKDAEETGHVTN
ncbi:hypothetical protein DAEQUDRAFT_808608 [Daedalea quercina L-15889]|uniref:Uncharacterized protein n=1 Tax=Daedalea quercina L-15889 TaxID=1314783 RepID=A0A165T8C1_9APHY|nr:hypothetical protein DAEQUDRAFT_808608 [Daedalea quercina L-15889]